MVTRLEKTLKPPHYVFKSPDHLMDSDINKLREVDGSITFQLNGREERISIECRKRGVKQDVTWIEQLACKMRALKLSGTIAVSSKGFSKAAYAKARRHGITLNTYKEVTANFSQNPLTINHIRRTWRLLEFQYMVSNECPEIPQDLQSAFRDRIVSQNKDADIVRLPGSGQVITLGQIIEAALDNSHDLTEGKSEKRFKVSFQEHTACLVEFPESVFLEDIIVRLEIEISRQSMANLVFGKYEDTSIVIMEAVKGKFASRGKEMELVLFFKSIKVENA